MGAPVKRAAQTEIGWEPLSFTEAGQRSPLRHLSSSVFHWHGETFEMPVGATHLASTPLCRNQAFSVGRNLLAIQCHPEVTARGLEQWYVGNVGELQALGLSPARMREQARQHAAQLTREARLFLVEWLSGLLPGKSDSA
jgi:GMP synthase (glutamine-hydrolysing)